MKTLLTLLLTIPLLAAAQIRPITMLDQIKAELPIGLALRKGKHWQPQAVALANATLKETVIGRPVAMTLKFNRIDAPGNTSRGPAIVGHVEGPFMQVNGIRVELRIHVYFESTQLNRLASFSGRQDLRFHGKIARADFSDNGGVLNLDFVEARAGEPDPPEPPATRSVAEAAMPAGPFAARVRILSAIYGSGGRTVDVTARVREHVEVKRQMFSVTPESLGADPAPGQQKNVTIKYLKDGKSREQHRTHTENILWEGFYAPQDAEELSTWLLTVKWKGPQGEEFTFGKDGRLRSKTYYPAWRAVAQNKIFLDWGGGTAFEAHFDWKWSSFTEQGGMRNKFTRID